MEKHSFHSFIKRKHAGLRDTLFWQFSGRFLRTTSLWQAKHSFLARRVSRSPNKLIERPTWPGSWDPRPRRNSAGNCLFWPISTWPTWPSNDRRIWLLDPPKWHFLLAERGDRVDTSGYIGSSGSVNGVYGCPGWSRGVLRVPRTEARQPPGAAFSQKLDKTEKTEKSVPFELFSWILAAFELFSWKPR